MKPLHSWNVSVTEAIRIQEKLRGCLILKKTFSGLKTVGGGDVAYSTGQNSLVGAITVLSYPDMQPIEETTACGEISFPYLPGLLSFREGPILIKAFQKLKVKPDLMIFDAQGIAHPRGFGLASHLGLWLDLPSIGCAKTPLLNEFDTFDGAKPRFLNRGKKRRSVSTLSIPRSLDRGVEWVDSPGISKGSYDWVNLQGKRAGAVLRTRQGVKPVFVSPGHRMDLMTSIDVILRCCHGYRIPEPLRKAHQISLLQRKEIGTKSQAPNTD